MSLKVLATVEFTDKKTNQKFIEQVINEPSFFTNSKFQICHIEDDSSMTQEEIEKALYAISREAEEFFWHRTDKNCKYEKYNNHTIKTIAVEFKNAEASSRGKKELREVNKQNLLDNFHQKLQQSTYIDYDAYVSIQTEVLQAAMIAESEAMFL